VTPTTLEYAQQYRSVGINVIPIRADASKAPAIDEWGSLQERKATENEITQWFRNGNGLAAVGGQISGNLEVIDFDEASLYDEWCTLIDEHLGTAFISRLIVVKTPRPGVHVIFQCSAVKGSQKLAQERTSQHEIKTLIETKANGGYFLLPGSPPGCHPAGRTYELLQGSFRSIPEITPEERDVFLSSARSFDRIQREVHQPSERKSRPAGELSPGDLFNQTATWTEVLEPHGFKVSYRRGDSTYWRRPGKVAGVSASTNYGGYDYFYPFSTSLPFDTNRGYTKFAVYSILEHNGDFSAAARAITRRFAMDHPDRIQRSTTSDLEAERAAIQEEGTPHLKHQPDAAEQVPPFVAPSHWKRLDLADLSSWECEPLKPIVDGVIAAGNLVTVAAASQTGKTLKGIYLARKILNAGNLYERYPITPVDRVGYLVLEDPARRIQSRMLDTDHEFPQVERGRLVFHVAPSFTLTDGRMVAWMESTILTDRLDVLFIDTYQKATPGLNSFDDEEQSKILHQLANLTRKLNVTIVVLDHIRKSGDSRGKRGELSLDDVKGSGAKVQNADVVILLERTPDKKQLKFQAFSKDFDTAVRILLNIAPKGSDQPKFSYASDLDELGSRSSERGAANRLKVLEAMVPGVPISVPLLAKETGFGRTSVQNHLKRLTTEGKVRDNGADGKFKRYERIATSENGDSGDKQTGERTRYEIN
jgi:hypothetical protein